MPTWDSIKSRVYPYLKARIAGDVAAGLFSMEWIDELNLSVYFVIEENDVVLNHVSKAQLIEWNVSKEVFINTAIANLMSHPNTENLGSLKAGNNVVAVLYDNGDDYDATRILCKRARIIACSALQSDSCYAAIPNKNLLIFNRDINPTLIKLTEDNFKSEKQKLTKEFLHIAKNGDIINYKEKFWF